MATCPGCNVEIDASDRFCAHCGAAIPQFSDGSSSSVEAGPPPDSPTPSEPPSAGMAPSTSRATPPPSPAVPPNPPPGPAAAAPPPTFQPAPPVQGAPGYGVIGTPKTSGKAVWSLVLSLVCCGLGSILALILGYQAKKEIAASGGWITGDGVATTGIVLGWIGVGLTVLIIVSSAGG